jgi:hypothetical protein
VALDVGDSLFDIGYSLPWRARRVVWGLVTINMPVSPSSPVGSSFWVFSKKYTRYESIRSERRIGRLLGRNSRAAGGFKIELAEAKTSAAGLQLRWSRLEAWRQWARLNMRCWIGWVW